MLKKIVIKGAKEHNLKNISLEIPKDKFVVITGLSGSGKSSLVNQTLYPILSREYHSSMKKALPYVKTEGLLYLDKVIEARLIFGACCLCMLISIFIFLQTLNKQVWH